MTSLSSAVGPSWDGCGNFGYLQQLEVLLLSCLGRCSDFSAVTYNPALVRMKQCLKWQHKPSAPCGRCKNRPIAAGSALNVTFLFLRVHFPFARVLPPNLGAFTIHTQVVKVQGDRRVLCCLGSRAIIAAHCRAPGPGSLGEELDTMRKCTIYPVILLFYRGLNQQSARNFRADWLGVVTLCGHKFHVSLRQSRGNVSTSCPSIVNLPVSSDLDLFLVGSIFLPVGEASFL